VTYFDTAPTYGTEEIVGRALEGRRSEVVVSTKIRPRDRDTEVPIDAAAVRASVEASLGRLRSEVIDVLHVHAVRSADYPFVRDEIAPALVALRDAGLVRHLAISEEFGSDPGHEMLGLALEDDLWDVMMVGFNLLNPSAATRLFPTTSARSIGVEVMYAVRRALSRPERLRELVTELVASGALDGGRVDATDPLASSSTGAARPRWSTPPTASPAMRPADRWYSPAREVPSTSPPNIASINAPALPDADLAVLHECFGHLDQVSGD